MKQADFKAPLNKKCNVMRCDAGKNEIKQKSKFRIAFELRNDIFIGGDHRRR